MRTPLRDELGINPEQLYGMKTSSHADKARAKRMKSELESEASHVRKTCSIDSDDAAALTLLIAVAISWRGAKCHFDPSTGLDPKMHINNEQLSLIRGVILVPISEQTKE